MACPTCQRPPRVELETMAFKYVHSGDFMSGATITARRYPIPGTPNYAVFIGNTPIGFISQEVDPTQVQEVLNNLPSYPGHKWPTYFSFYVAQGIETWDVDPADFSKSVFDDYDAEDSACDCSGCSLWQTLDPAIQTYYFNLRAHMPRDHWIHSEALMQNPVPLNLLPILVKPTHGSPYVSIPMDYSAHTPIRSFRFTRTIGEWLRQEYQGKLELYARSTNEEDARYIGEFPNNAIAKNPRSDGTDAPLIRISPEDQENNAILALIFGF